MQLSGLLSSFNMKAVCIMEAPHEKINGNYSDRPCAISGSLR